MNHSIRLTLMLTFATATFCQGVEHRSSEATLHNVKANVPDGQLRLVFRGLPGDIRSVIGVRVDSTKETATAAIGAVTYPPVQTACCGIRSGPPQISDLAREQIRTEPGTMEFLDLAQVQGTLLVYVALPAGTKLRVESNSTILSDLTPGSGLLIDNGVVYSRPVEGIHSVLLYLTASQLPKSQGSPTAASLRALKNGEMFANLDLLASHLSTYKHPSSPVRTEAMCSHCGDPNHGSGPVVVVRIRVDEQGLASVIGLAQGDQALMPGIEAAVREWKFAPFLMDGHPRSVVGSVPFFVRNDGSLITTIRK